MHQKTHWTVDFEFGRWLAAALFGIRALGEPVNSTLLSKKI
jgi:hypothetical protein